MPTRRRGPTSRLIPVSAAALALLVSACGVDVATQQPSPPASSLATQTEVPSARPSPSPSTAPQTSSASPTATPATAARPYDAATLLQAMADSRRPGGVPDRVQTAAIADQMAQAIWTYDGQPWPSLAISGSCGPEACTVDVSGTPPAAAGEDLYTFDVRPGDGSVEVLLADLHGYPRELDATLDQIARKGVDPDRLVGLSLVSARWVAPPHEGQYVLSYRSGGEEGSPALDVVVDLPSGTVLDVRHPG